MSDYHVTAEEEMAKQRKERQQEEQYGILTSLGWEGAGSLFLVLSVAVIVYAVFFR